MAHTRTFTYSAENLSPRAAVYHAAGALLGSSACYEFQNAVCQAAKEGQRQVVIDLGGVERIDSCGIGILAAIVVSLRNGGGELILAAAPDPIERLLDAMWFLRIVDHEPTLPAAIARVKSA